MVASEAVEALVLSFGSEKQKKVAGGVLTVAQMLLDRMPANTLVMRALPPSNLVMNAHLPA